MKFEIKRPMRQIIFPVPVREGRQEVTETSLRHIRRLGVFLALLMSFPLMATTVEDDDAVWSSIDCGSEEQVELYLKEFPDGVHAEEANGCIAWQKIRTCEDIRLVETFLREYPEAIPAKEAQTCLERLEENRRQNDRVEGMLNECRAHYESHRLTRGSGGNALDCYRKVLDIEPGNGEALSGIASIERYYIEKAESALEGSRPDDALFRIERLQSINPEHPLVEELKWRVDDLRERLAAQQQLLRDIDAELARGQVEEARSLFETGRKEEYLDSKTASSLERKIERAEEAVERERLLQDGIANVRDLIAAGEVEAARSAIDELAQMGLDEDRRSELESALNTTVVAQFLNKCDGYEDSRLWDAALSCCREVLEIDGDNQNASRCLVRVPYKKVGAENRVEEKVEGYHRFVQGHPNSIFAKFARLKLEELETQYWGLIKESDEASSYRLYLEIYPDGQFEDNARRGLPAGE